MSISKVKQIRLETTAQYQPISDLNVRFFNQDINTSVLDFIVTRNDNPIPLGIDNIEATIVLTSNKFKISDEVKIKDGMNGILTYTLPDDILERHGKVTGQIYIGIKGKEDTVVQRLFSFDIEDSLINSFDAETKLVYIRKF
ncbi:MAG: phage baseplate upper protein, partial [Staphylococcus equorum]|nr:phage baseplate upper protein [Staphylococcus equorum]